MNKQQTTFGQVAEDYIQWIKSNRTERFWKTQERILREDVLPAIGDVPISNGIGILSDNMHSALSLPLEKLEQGLRAVNAVNAVLSWSLKYAPYLYVRSNAI